MQIRDTQRIDMWSLEQRLSELRAMQEQGTISESEHHVARAVAFATV